MRSQRFDAEKQQQIHQELGLQQQYQLTEQDSISTVLPKFKQVRIQECTTANNNESALQHPQQVINFSISANSYSLIQDATDAFDEISIAVDETNLDILPNTNSSELSRAWFVANGFNGGGSQQLANVCPSRRDSQFGNKLAALQQKKDYSLAEHLETIRQVWLEHSRHHFKRNDNYMTNELPLKLILTFLVKHGIALDRDKAKLTIKQEIGEFQDENMISFGEFQSIFVRGLFKQSLENRSEAFKGHMLKKKGDKTADLNLRQQIDLYQREKMIGGLKANEGSEQKNETKMILENMSDYNKQVDQRNNLRQSRETYLKFLKDPKKFFAS